MTLKSVSETQHTLRGGFGDTRHDIQVNGVYVDGVSATRTGHGAVNHDALFTEALIAKVDDRAHQRR